MNVRIKSINKAETLKYLGYGKKKPDIKTSVSMLVCEKRLLDTLIPKYTVKIFDIVSVSEDSVQLKDCSVVLRGRDIAKHLENCEKAALLCATVGNGADSIIRTLQVGNMSEAVITDAMASSAVEQVCAEAEQYIRSMFSEMFVTWRYSPGYGDFPISQQADFIELTDAARQVGVTVNESFVLTPLKSVTAVLGLSRRLKQLAARGCDGCSLKDRCAFRDNCGRK